MTTTDQHTAPRLRGERGAVVPEAAIVGPLFFFLLFSVFEFGLLFRTYLSTETAARDGVRAGSAAEIPGYSDFEILTEVRRGASALSRGDLERIVIFQGDRNTGLDSTVPAACMNTAAGFTGVDDLCQVYYEADLSTARTNFVERGHWPGADRDDNRSSLGTPDDPEGTDFIGVLVRSRHQAVTGIFGTARSLTSTVVMRIEPKRNLSL